MTDTVRDLGELELIERITSRLPGHADVLIGAGDDCAVVRAGGDEDWVLTSDPVIAGIHFSEDDAGYRVGRKAIGRVLSDLAAMGAEPRWALIDLVAPHGTHAAALEEVYDGALALSAEYGLLVVGGDVAEGPALELHVFGVGAVPHGAAVARSGAKPGDRLYVTGTLGGSLMGRHLDIEPRLNQGAWLRDWATSMIDVSDGLASDIRHIADVSGTGCLLKMADLPVAESAMRMGDGIPPVDHALHDGEDFELLFTIPEEREDEFPSAWTGAFDLPCTRIGVMTDRLDLLECVFPSGETVALEGCGYVHFRNT